jgi:hypothetical protein
MRRFHVEIEGITPILFNRCFGKGITPTIEDRVYRNKEGLYCPAMFIKKAMILVCRRGRKALRKGVFIEPAEIPFYRKKHDFVHHFGCSRYVGLGKTEE